MDQQNQPFGQFSESEMRFVLAEAIKRSNVSVERLYALFSESQQYPPDWDNMLMPNGRTISQCKIAFESLRPLPWAPSQLSTSQPPPQQQPNYLNQAPYPNPPPKRQSMNLASGPPPKRRKSGTQTPTGPPPLGVPLAPRPSNGSGSPGMVSMPPSSAPPGKKRGRPSKAETERKQREAMERGEIIPSGLAAVSQGQEGPRTGIFAPVTIAPAPPSQSPHSVMTPTQLSSPQVGMEPVSSLTMSGEAPGKKRKPRAPAKPRATKPGESSFSINQPIGQSVSDERPDPPPSTTETAPAGPVAASEEAGKPATVIPVTSEAPVPVPEAQQTPEVN